jgi:hypothetical protein
MGNWDGDPSLTGCTFSRNSATDWGGGMLNYGGSSPRLTNCTFSENSGDQGGGVYNYWSSLTLTDCTFSGNLAAFAGGGMSNDESGNCTLTNCAFSDNSAAYWAGGMGNWSSGNATLTNCTFMGNSAGKGGGGMDNCWESSATLTNCTFSGNSAEEWGGGMYNCWESSATLTNCTFSGNSAERGGGMYNLDYSDPSLANCTFSGNSADRGAGMSNDTSSPTLSNCTFSDNSADKYGGGVYNSVYSSPTLANCAFAGNSAEEDGGGMYNLRSRPTLTDCKFSGNSAEYSGAGMVNHDWSRTTLTNCTFAQNSAKHGNALACGYSTLKFPSNVELINCILWNGGDEIWNNDGSTVDISYSDIRSGQTGIFDPGEAVIWGAGNIDDDPCFAELGCWDLNGTPDDANDDFWVDGDYHLKSEAGRWNPNSQSWVQDQASSLCIDAGDPNTCIGFEPNPNAGVVNMGAYGGTAEASLSPSGVDCITADHPDYDEWVTVGEPVCWCYHRQCHGDTDCKAQGKNKYWVSTDDLDILIAAWNKPLAEIDGQTVNSVPLICADFDHLPQGKKKYRVSTNDLDILIANWNVADKPDPDCP